jgi:predicted GNAT family N-acyltransferase
MSERNHQAVQGESAAGGKRKSHLLSQMDPRRVARRVVLFRPNLAMIEPTLKAAQVRMGALAGAAMVRAVGEHHPDSLWGVARRASFDPAHPKAEGFVAILFLNRMGLNTLAAGTFDYLNPALTLLARSGERPAGIFIWAAYVPGALAPAVTLIFEMLSKPPYDGVSLYSHVTTKEGGPFTEALGFRKGATVEGVEAPHLYQYERPSPKTSNAPLYDTYRPGNAPKTVSVTVARDFNDLLRVATIRGAVYVGEQECPFDEEFDGNDLAATHLLGYVGDEPAGCIRIRNFADFAKVERLAVRKEYRHTILSFQLVRAAIELCRKKGYRRIYGHAQKRLVPFWKRFGAAPMPGGKEFVFSDFDYVELMGPIPPDPNAIAIGTDPFVIIRPEGRWHEPGILERSAQRPISRPSVGGPRL